MENGKNWYSYGNPKIIGDYCISKQHEDTTKALKTNDIKKAY